MADELDYESTDEGQGWLDDLRVCLGVLTRLPVPGGAPAESFSVAAASRFFPVIGIGVGALGAAVLFGLQAMGLAPSVAILLGLLAMVLATGGMHEDGLADTADGMGGGDTAESRLAIMRDSHMGSYGALAIIFAIGLRFSALVVLFGGSHFSMALAMIGAAAFSRSLLSAVMHYLPPARTDGLSAKAGRPDFDRMAVSLIIGWVTGFLCLGFFFGLFVMIVCSVMVYLFLRWVEWRISGQTGDILGAVQQISETTVLVLAAAAMQ
jgi:adenosylcobinamide-GDP ribazoletransferase